MSWTPTPVPRRNGVWEIEAHKGKMQALGIETEQTRLDPAWLEAMKAA